MPTLKLGDTAPDFEAETTEGTINFHDWIGDGWAVLFSHPKDFTPVCTTELGYMASIKPEFDKRDTKIIGLSVDPLDKHADWAKDIEETQGTAPNYPMIGDSDFKVSKLYGMLPDDVEGDPGDRTPADNQTVRNVFVIGPDKKIKLILIYPMTTGRNFDEVLRVDRLAAPDREAQGRHAGPVEGRRRRDHRRVGQQRRGEGAVPGRLGVPQAVHPDRPAAELRDDPWGTRVSACPSRCSAAGRPTAGGSCAGACRRCASSSARTARGPRSGTRSVGRSGRSRPRRR